MTRTSNTEYVILTGTRLRETDKAIHFSVSKVGDVDLEDPVTHWFPISQMAKQTYNPERSGEDTIHVAQWICVQKELV